MTTFLLDARALASGGDSGADRVFRALVRDLPGLLQAHERLLIIARPGAVTLPSPAPPRTALSPCDVPTAGFKQHFHMPGIVKAIAPDVWLYPQYDLPPVPKGVAAVATVYDLTPIHEPGYFGAGRDLRALAAAAMIASTCARADRIVTAADAITADLRQRFPHLAHKFTTCRPGPSCLTLDRSVERHQNRFVYVGNHRPHKRVPFLLRAFARARKSCPDLELVLAGRRDDRFPHVFSALEENGGALKSGVRVIESPSDAEVAHLIASARTLVFPSVGEGFGFPVVEAYSVGTPAIVADAGSLPEVAGAAAMVVVPDHEKAWAEAMITMANDDDTWHAHRSKIDVCLQRFSWTAFAETMMRAMRDALAQKRSA